MATITVTNNSGLTAALKSAVSGDTITLATGHYTLNTSGYSKAVTITSTGGAVLDSMNLSRTSNMTIDNVDFNGADGEKNAFRVWGSDHVTIRNGDMEGVASGFGLGRGLLLQASTDFTFENMTMHGFSVGVFIDGIDGFTFRNNSLFNIGLDGMGGGDIHDAVISGNSISLTVPAGTKHTDGLQFWNTGANAPSSNMLIENNLIQAHNTQSHGIYMANAVANAGGGASSFFEDVTIRGNTIVSGDGLGLSWGQTDNLDIHDNIVLKDPTLPVSNTAPSIRVHTGATDVSVTGNVTHKAPLAADAGWQTVQHTGGGWTIADNPIIRVGASLAEAQALLAGTDPGPPDIGNGVPDLFRFDAAGPTDVVDGLDFSEGDVIELYNYKGGTFYGIKADANPLVVTVSGAVIDSLADIRELDTASAKVSVRNAGNDTLAIDISQPAGTHTIEIRDMVETYFDLA